METKTIIAMLLMAGLASATDVTCVPFSGTTSISSGVVVVDIYTDYLCTSSIFTGGFTYAGKGWQVTLGNCTTALSLNLTEYETYYYKYLINGVATSDGSCHSFIATNPTNGTTSVNNYFSGASITNLNVTNNITNNITTTINITNNITNNITTTINITNNITNNITGSSNWTDIFNFPVACNAGEAVTKINTTLTCSPFLTAETDPIWTAEKVNYTATANLPVYNNLSGGDIVGLVGNWTLDKPGYYTKANVDAIGNLTNYYNKTSMPVYNNGTSNLTLADIAANIGNWTDDKSDYTTTANLPVYNNGSSNLTLAQVAANIGNWTADKPSYTTTANLPVYNNGSVTSITAGTGLTGGAITASGTIALNDTYVIGLCPIYNNGSSNLTMSDVVAGVGNWTADKGSYAPYSAFNNLSLTDITASIGNWTADKPDYTTTANLPVYNNLSGTDVGVLMINGTIIRASNTSWITANQYTYNNITNLSLYQVASLLPVYNNLSAGDVSNAVGNWTGNASSYTATSGIAALMGNTTIARTGSTTTCGAGQWMVNATTTTSGITSVCTAIPTYNNGTLGTAENTTIAALLVSNTSVNNKLLSLNQSKAQAGTCAANQFMQSTTNTSAPSCQRPDAANITNAMSSTDNTTINANISSINVSLSSHSANISSINVSVALAHTNIGALNTSLSANISSLNVSVALAHTNIGALNTSLSANISSLNVSVTTATNKDLSLNQSKAQAGVCAANQFIQSTTNTSAPTCARPDAANITNVMSSTDNSTLNANISSLNVSVALAHTRITSLNTSLSQNISSLNVSKANIGTATCAAGTVAQNITTSATGITSQCIAATAATGSGNVTATSGTNLYYARFTNNTNIANGNIYDNATCVIINGSTSTFYIC